MRRARLLRRPLPLAPRSMSEAPKVRSLIRDAFFRDHYLEDPESGGGQSNDDAGAAAGFGFDVDGAAVGFDDAADNG